MADHWGSAETGINKAGTFITIIPAIFAALSLTGFMPLGLSAAALFGIVSAGGALGGAVNVLGRGPLWAGALSGLILALGGFGAVYYWINERESVRKFELMIAFVVGAAPGFVLDMVLGKMFGARGDRD